MTGEASSGPSGWPLARLEYGNSACASPRESASAQWQEIADGTLERWLAVVDCNGLGGADFQYEFFLSVE